MKNLVIIASLFVVGCGKLTVENNRKITDTRLQEGQRLTQVGQTVVEAGAERTIKAPEELVANLFKKCLAGVAEKNRAYCSLSLDFGMADEAALSRLIEDDMKLGSTYFIARMDSLHIYYESTNKLNVSYDAEDSDTLSDEQIQQEFTFALKEIVRQLSERKPQKAPSVPKHELKVPESAICVD